MMIDVMCNLAAEGLLVGLADLAYFFGHFSRLFLVCFQQDLVGFLVDFALN
jgi:hypothetical protein